MENKDKTFEVKIIGKEKAKELENKVINKIGEDADAVSFISGKIIELICYEVAIIVIFLLILFISIFEKFTLVIIFSLIFVLLGISTVIQNIYLINKLQKTQIKSKK